MSSDPNVLRTVGRTGFGLRPAGLAPLPMPLSKWMFDKVFALVALAAFGPLMIGLAVAIWLRDGGPVIFAHERVGQGGRAFRCLKFRTMVQDADGRLERLLHVDPIAREEWEASFKLTSDPRVNRFGAFLRKSSLDELPQLFNILRGDMSVVGPRPVTRAECAYYGEHYDTYRSVRPGLTGAWQVGGRSDASYPERVAMDVDYVLNWSFGRDVAIVLGTVGTVMRGEGAC